MSYKKVIDTIRLLSVDMIEKSNSGHPGMPLGCAPMMFVLWCRIMNYNPENPLWSHRDRFVLSNGHGCALLYSMLYLLGYDYSLSDLKEFRQIGSKTPGHPEYNTNMGVEITTGPLGQGIANGVGMAIASKKMNIDNKIYVMCGDGCLMEGVSYESASIAGHLALDNLVILYDDNGITIDGRTDITFTENTRARFIALQWNVLEVLDGDKNTDDIYDKLLLAKNTKDKPTIIFVKTTIGYGSLLSDTSSCHGAPLGLKNTELLKELFGFDKTQSFSVDEDVKDFFKRLKEEKIQYYKNFTLSKTTDTRDTIDKEEQIKIDKLKNEISKMQNGEKSYSTRDSSSVVLRKIVEDMDNIIVGSADLAESNKTMVCQGCITKDDFSQKYLNYGIREHAMCAIANGISTYGILPVVSTFLVFITYCLAPIRMSALSNHKVLYVLTHDSVFLGEDGPTHQPVESLTILRSIPHLLTIRPCDVNEVSASYIMALEHTGPTALIFSRQLLPNIEKSCVEKAQKGGYIIYQSESESESIPDLVIVSTGSEVSLAIDVAKELFATTKTIVRVVSMPCTQLFDQQDALYKASILSSKKKMSLEAGSTLGWYKYVDYTYGIDTFGESAKITDIKHHFGFTTEKIISYIRSTLLL